MRAAEVSAAFAGSILELLVTSLCTWPKFLPMTRRWQRHLWPRYQFHGSSTCVRCYRGKVEVVTPSCFKVHSDHTFFSPSSHTSLLVCLHPHQRNRAGAMPPLSKNCLPAYPNASPMARPHPHSCPPPTSPLHSPALLQCAAPVAPQARDIRCARPRLKRCAIGD